MHDEHTAPSLPHRPGPGALVRALATALPGVREVADHIHRYGAAWDQQTMASLGSRAPLWLALGDSTAQGIGAEAIDRSYVAQLHARRPHAVDDLAVANIAVSGAKVADVLRDQMPIVDAYRTRVELVTCSIGSNDLLRSPNPHRVTKALRGLFDALEGLPRVAIATLPIGSLSIAGRMVNAMIRKEAPERGFVVADVATQYRAPYRGKVAADRFHPNGNGYRDWTEAFARALDW